MLDGLFTVKQTKHTWKRVVFTFVLVILMVMSVPLYFRYERAVYENYYDEYMQAKQLIMEYYKVHEEFPIGERFDFAKEKDLRIFFTEHKMSMNRKLYYVDTALLLELKDFKYTYVIDVDNQFVFTREFVVYAMERWHYAK